MRRVFVLLICWFVVVNVNAGSVTCQERHCIAVVDAGSTGSRLHLYAYDLDTSNNPVQISELWSKKIKPGLASVEPNQHAIDAYLSILFESSPEQHMPVYFYATGGMRLLPHPTQQLYYQAVQQWFSAEAQWQLMDAKTISGNEEGVFGWLAVNYQLGAFKSTDKPLASVMDMGGASVQVTFPVQNVENIDHHDIVEIDIYGRHLVLFVHSFLGLGQSLLSHQFLNEESCFANGYQLPSGLLGKGDASSCRGSVSKLINTVHEVSSIVKPAIASNASNKWYAMDGVALLAENKPFSFENKQFTNQGLLEQADSQICHQEWQDVHAQYSSNNYLYGYCLFPAYYYALMVDGYGLHPDQSINFLPQGQDLGWTLGVVLHKH